MRLLLTSEFDVSFDQTKHLFDENSAGKTVIFIPTAAYGEGFEPSYEGNIKPFEDLGMTVKQFDLVNKTSSEVTAALATADIIYVGPGNTFYLLEHIQKSGFKDILIQRLQAGVFYIGSSAGSIITSPDIAYIAEMDEPDKASLTDFTGLGLTNFLFLPHLDHPEMRHAAHQIMQQYQNTPETMIVLRDHQALYIEDNIVQMI